MPTERFLNLPAEKRQRVADAARREMCRVPYPEVSINQIIKAADIPRGSFYQYFTDKDDLLDYLMWDFRDALLERLNQSLEGNGGDAFATFADLFDFIVEYGTRRENIEFCTNIFTSQQMHNTTTADIVEMLSNDWEVEKYRFHESLKRFRYQQDSEMRYFLEMLIVIFRSAIIETFHNLERLEEIQEGFRHKMELLKNGVMKQPEET